MNMRPAMIDKMDTDMNILCLNSATLLAAEMKFFLLASSKERDISSFLFCASNEVSAIEMPDMTLIDEIPGPAVSSMAIGLKYPHKEAKVQKSTAMEDTNKLVSHGINGLPRLNFR